MAEEKVGIKITVDGSEVTESVGNVRKELKAANTELIRAQEEFGQFSAEAVAAAKKVAGLKDQIGDAAEVAALFDPGKKFAAFSSAIQGVAGGFAAVQGAIGLLGVESEDLQKQLLKVQSALALSEGLSTLSDLAPKLEGLKTILANISIVQKANAAANRLAAVTMTTFGVSVNTTSVAFRVLRGAIIATGIGVLVVALGSVVEAMSNFTSAAEDAAEAQKKLNEETVKYADVGLKAEQEFIDRSTKLLVSQAKARGESAENIAKIESDALKLRKKSFERYYEEVKNADAEAAIQAERNIKNINNEIQVAENNAAAERLEKQKEAEQKRRDDAKQQAEERLKERQQIEQEGAAQLQQLTEENARSITEIEIENENDRAKKLIDIQLKQDTDRVNATKLSAELKTKIVAELEKKAQIERDKVQKKIDDEEKQRAEETAKRVADIRTEIVENSITDETERRLFGIRAKYAAEISEVEKGEGDVAALVAALKERQAQEEDAVEKERKEKKAAERIAELEEITANDQLDFEARTAAIEQLKTLNQQYLDDKLISQQEFNKNLQDLAAAEVDIEQKKFQAKIAQLDAYSQAITGLGNLIGQNTAVGKALAIAAATIDTYTATASQFRLASQNPITLVNPAYPYIVASTALLSGLARVRQIVAVKVPNSGGAGGGASAPAISGGGGVGAPPISGAAPLQPQRPSAQVFELGQQSIRGINTATQRAYVVESDITSSQERVTRLNRAARLG